ncbi:hypothetical protein DFH09DRAFT_863866, partial [Mycena vulgaris]
VSEKDLPHHTKMTDEIRKRTRQVEARLRQKLQNMPGQVSFTSDTWTSQTCASYLGVTGHYI